jgi:hypothetical protein
VVRKGRHFVSCKECGAEGAVDIGRTLANGRVKVTDRIAHAETCPMFRREQPRHLKRKRWRKQETRANALVGARETVASGAIGEDGDGRRFHEWRVESKRTTALHYNLRQDVWIKLVHGALVNGEEPLLHVELNTSNNPVQRLVVMRLDLFEALTGDRHPPCDPSQENRVSWRIEYKLHPQMVRLGPVGVAVTEEEFERLKETL